MKRTILACIFALAAAASGQRLEATIDLRDTFGVPAYDISLAVDSRRGLLYVAGDESDTVVIVDEATRAPVARMSIDFDVMRLFYSEQCDELLCFYWGSSTADVMDCATRERTGSIDLGGSPEGFCYDSLDAKLYCFTDDGIAVVIDCGADTVVARIDVSVNRGRQRSCYSPTLNRIYCAADDGESLKVIDCARDSVVAAVPAGHRMDNLCWVGTTGSVYASCPEDTVLRVFDPGTNSLKDSLVGPGGDPMMWSPTSGKLYVGRGFDLYVVDPITNAFHSVLYDDGNGGVQTLVSNPVLNKVYAIWGCTCGVGTGYVLDGVPDTVLAEFPGAICDDACYSDASNTLYCGLGIGGSVEGIDGTKDSLVMVLSSEYYLTGLETNEAKGKVYCYFDWPPYLLVIDAASHTVSRRLLAMDVPYVGATNTDGSRVYALCWNAGVTDLVVMDGDTDTVCGRIPLAEAAWFLQYNPRSNRVYAAGGEVGVVQAVDCERESVVKVLGLPESPAYVIYNSVSDLLYVFGDSSLTTIDCGADSVCAHFDFGTRAYAASWDSRNNRVCVAAILANRVYVLNSGGNTLIASLPTPARPYAVNCDSLDNRMFIACGDGGSSLYIVDCATLEARDTLEGVPGLGGCAPGYSALGDLLVCAGHGDSVGLIACERESVIASFGVDGDLMTPVAGRGWSSVYAGDEYGSKVYAINVQRNILSPVYAGPAQSPPRRQQTVAGDQLIVLDRLRVELRDVAGRRVAEMKHGANDISSIPPGIYFLVRGEGMVTRKIVIAR